jgi:16S rRNA (uracil1498-N3)-methyltransferase
VSPATFLVPVESLAHAQVDSVVELDKAVSHHMAVTRIQPDEVIDLVDGMGTRVSGVISRPGEFLVHMINHEQIPDLQVTVVQALLKGDRLERAIEMMTEVGAVGFIPWEADHGIVKWTAEKAKRNHLKWEHVVRASVEQSRRSFLPEVLPLVNSKALTTLFPNYDHVIIMDESGGYQRLSGLPVDGLRVRVLLVIGPEGGLSEAERLTFTAAGNARMLTLGSAVLRGATAGVVGLSYLFTRFGEWGSAPSGSVEG